MALNSGPYEAKKLYEKSNGNIYQFLKDRKSFYDNLIKRKPSQEEHRKGWYNRLKDIENNMNEIVNKGYYTPPYQNEKTPYDKNFNDPNLNTDFHNYKQNELQNIKNKYLYLKNRGVSTGQAANVNYNSPLISESGYAGYTNPLTGNNRIFTREEIGAMNDDEFAQNEKEIMAQIQAMNGIMPTNGDMLKESITGGGVVYVQPYTRSDGTKVQGYYRSRPGL